MTWRILVLGTLVFLPACLSTGSGEEGRVIYYQLSPEGDWSGSGLPLTVSLKPFTEAEALGRQEIRFLTSDVEGGYWTDDRWSDPVGAMMRGVVQEDLERSRLFARVNLLENAGFADLLLDCVVHRMEEEDRGPDWFGVVEATFELSRARDGAILYHRRMRMEEKSGARTVREVVRALSRATSRMLNELNTDLSAKLAGVRE